MGVYTHSHVLKSKLPFQFSPSRYHPHIKSELSRQYHIIIYLHLSLISNSTSLTFQHEWRFELFTIKIPSTHEMRVIPVILHYYQHTVSMCTYFATIKLSTKQPPTLMYVHQTYAFDLCEKMRKTGGCWHHPLNFRFIILVVLQFVFFCFTC